MHNRRTFLKNSGTFTLGSLAFAATGMAALNAKKMHAAGVQLFTFFNTIDKDVAGTLKQIAAAGYQEIESAFSMKGGYYGLNPKEFAALAKQSGLRWVSHHVSGTPFKVPAGGFKMPGDTTKRMNVRKLPPMKTLQDNYKELIDEAAEGGVKYLVCASIALGNADEIKHAVIILNRAGELAKKSGITLCYHNHTHEFETVDGLVPYQVLLSETNSATLNFELDLGWATVAGADPVELFKKHPGRFPLWHVKDINAATKQPVEVGNGMVDFKRIFSYAKEAGMQHFFVEQDGAPQPLENITTSYRNLLRLLS